MREDDSYLFDLDNKVGRQRQVPSSRGSGATWGVREGEQPGG